MIKLASNYMSEIEELLNENKIEIDFLKYPSLSNDSSFNSRDEFYNRIGKIKKIKPLLYHGILPNRVNVCNENFTKEFDIELMNHVIELSDTKGISLHFDGADLNDSKEKVVNQSVKNIQYLKKCFPNVEFMSFENVMGKCNQYVIDPEVIAHVIRETGVDFLYDVSHAYWSSQERNENFSDYVSKLPLERIYEIHINGWEEKNGDIQSHMMIQEEIYEHLSEILKKSSTKVITLEYGRHNDRIGSGCPIVTIDEINLKAKDEVHKQIIRLKEIVEKANKNDV